MTSIAIDNIPEELRSIPRWVVWRWTEVDGKLTKPPFDFRTGREGDAHNPGVHTDLMTVVEHVTEYSGIGLSLSAENPYSGVDLDHCLNENGEISPEAEVIVKRLNSYTEITPSGNGLRIWVRGKLPPGRRKLGKIEMYDRGRYFTVTGNHFAGTPTTIEERTEELASLHLETFGAAKNGEHAKRKPEPLGLSDNEVLKRVFASKHGLQIEAVYRGNISAYGDDHSAADLGLCSQIAFWTGRDADSIDRIFRTSALYRDKWERPDYRRMTIDKAMERADFYDPNYGNITLKKGGKRIELNGKKTHEFLERHDDPHRLARLFLGPNEERTLLFWNDEWHRWSGLAWRCVPNREIAAELTTAIKADFDELANGTEKAVPAVTVTLVNNAMQALRSLCLLGMTKCPQQPAWIGPREPGEDMPPVQEILPASNKMIHIPSFIAGEPYTFPLQARFFSPMNLGYPFVEQSEPPREWLAFLASIWPEDAESIDSLQEWMGYLLVPDTSLQKSLMVIGPKRSGKGTVIRLMQALVGHENVVSPTLGQLATNFGLAPLIGKTVAVISDARLSGRVDSQAIVESLLSISGEDAKTIDRKHMEAWTGRLLTRFVLVSNELPRLGDSSSALASRFVLLRMTESFLGREDTQLEKRLIKERPAILLWAIVGLARLRERGHFLQPSNGQELLDDFEELSSPIGQFITDCCDVDPDATVEVKILYDEWTRYCRENGRDHAGDVAGFGRMLHSALPVLKLAQPRRDGGRIRVYKGIKIKTSSPKWHATASPAF